MLGLFVNLKLIKYYLVMFLVLFSSYVAVWIGLGVSRDYVGLRENKGRSGSSLGELWFIISYFLANLDVIVSIYVCTWFLNINKRKSFSSCTCVFLVYYNSFHFQNQTVLIIFTTLGFRAVVLVKLRVHVKAGYDGCKQEQGKFDGSKLSDAD